MRKLTITLACLGLVTAVNAQQSERYFPGKWDDWEARKPEDMGMNPARIAEAVQFAQENFNARGGFNASNEPYGDTIGPIRNPSGMNGMIIRNGYIVAEWGDTNAVDMTFSVTKTYLSTTVGLAYDAGLIQDVKDPVRKYFPDGYKAVHNQEITWEQMLQQSSGWEGVLFGIPDWSDRYRPRQGRRPTQIPGEHYLYNDVRVNQLALSALNVWRKPLPQVLRERVMDPIGASPTWRWHGYENSWVNIDGQMMQSVSGGGHWGGGMWISTRDHARFGYLFLREGNWDGKQLVSKEWIEMAKAPSKNNATYGYMNWFLNSSEENKYQRAAPVGNVFFIGAGTNMVWVDPTHDMVVVVRWITNPRGFVQRVMAAFEDGRE